MWRPFLKGGNSANPVRPHPPLDRYYRTEEERLRRVRDWFDHSAAHYDWITQALSLGSGHWYRARILRTAGLDRGARVLDVACGTGVLAEAATRQVGPEGFVVGLDPSAGMLSRAQARGVRQLVQATAEAIPFADASFDLVTMGYALRHVADLETVFSEYRRVLRPGGRVLVLEISRPSSRFAYRALELWLGRVVPALSRLGGVKPRELMAYYWETIDRCVPPESIVEALGRVGLERPERRVELGIFSAYLGEA
ncbi:MAG: methyltransferase domain-containing protein [Thermoanaerobaculia bacterium]|jgi:demethylmenaquinone methyltransferase/2-methoxy-6-polyprenyl-1,4-benzoquinol methylase|nr:MAG: methyltransferase domain-containing protein [Thermoanaerobaculia bacterium]MBZ0101379.1 class I SAM-dependent methyltransferase [Thermoanaerobaculia bacterium]